jgi:hypothetical protein
MPSDGRYMYPHPPPNMSYDYGAYPPTTYDNPQYTPNHPGAPQRPPHPVNPRFFTCNPLPRANPFAQSTYPPHYGPPPHYVMQQQQWEAAWPPYSAPMHYPLASGQPPPEPVVSRPEPPPVETPRHEQQQPVVQPPKPPDTELQPPPTQMQANGNLNGPASQEKQKPHMNGNTRGAQLPEEFNFLKVRRCNPG